MLKAALQEHGRWVQAGFDVPVAVNVPPEYISDPEFPAVVAECLATAELPGSALILELVEEAAGNAASAGVLAGLRELGVRLAIDDFGTGFSSLSRLGDLPVEIIKLDISLVRPLLDNLAFRKVVELATELAHQLGARVVAEGVETEAIEAILLSLRCDEGQGHLYARPLPAQEFLRWIAEQGHLIARKTSAQQRTGTTPHDATCRSNEAVAPPRRPAGLWGRAAALWAGAIRAVGTRTVLFVAALLGAYGAWQIVRFGGRGHQTIIGDVAFVPINGLAIAAAVKVSLRRELGAATTRAWRLFALALAMYLVGDLLQLLYEVVLHSRTYPTWADAAYLAFYPLALAGLLALPSRRRNRGEGLRLLLDMATVFVGGAAVIWYVVFGPTLSDDLGLANLVATAYPLGDLVLLFGTIVLLLRGVPRSSLAALRLFGSGLVCFIAADITYDYVTVHGTYVGGDPVDSLWMVALAVIFMAAVCQLRAPHQPELTNASQAPTFRVSLLPYLAVAVAYVLLIVVAAGRVALYPLGGLICGAVVLMVLVSVRQLAALKDIGRLAGRYHALASVDLLTGLANRRHFMALGEAAFARAQRLDGPLVALLADIDGLRHINDGRGQAAGDRLLVEVAATCRASVRPTDIVARYGGDEIVLLLPGASNTSARRVAAGITAQMANLEGQDGLPDPVTISLGIAGSDGCRSFESLLARVDLALDEAKRAGSGSCRTYRAASAQVAMSD
jgi:diguanylate cyclase (GGDEF)-like protein